MSYNWTDYYELAKQLGARAEITGEELSEALFRSAVSRAYYAAYNLSLNYAKNLGYEYSNQRGRHEDLIKFFGDRGDADSKIIALRLESCRDSRTIVDYHTEIPDDYHSLNRIKDMTIAKVEDVFGLLKS
jgi:uncharacterized protein (UPF0332 family)